METRQTVKFALGTILVAAIALCGASRVGGADPLAATAAALTEARRLYLTGRYDEAAEILQDELQRAPVEAGIGLARCHAIRGRFDEALRVLQEAVEAGGQSADILAEQALVQWERGEHDAAQALIDRVLEADAECIPARWVEIQLFKTRGDIEAAKRVCRLLLDRYNQADAITSPDELRYVGLAAADYARWNRLPDQFQLIVNEILPSALQFEAEYWPAHLEMGRLFLEKHNQAEAARSLARAHAINAVAPDVLAAQARLALDQFDIDQARRLVGRAKGIHPDHLESLLVEADAHFALLEPRKAIAVLDVAKRENPHHPAMLGRLAAAVALRDGQLDPEQNPQLAAIIAEVTNSNRRGGVGEFYASMAAALDQCRQYPAASDWLRRAIEASPQLVGPRAQLGLIHMRLGDEAAARNVLEEAFEADPFNVRVKNTLEVLDVLDNYETLETDHFLIRFDPRRDRVLARCAADYLESIYPELTEHLGHAPAEKTLFEFFFDAKSTKGHGWFSARMVGLPQIHTIGACAGQMVALTSPSAMPEQKFNWARVLRHEFVHVINLQQTRFNVPHWFTEALAVRLEDLPRPAEWETVLVRRANTGQLFDLKDINLGFIRPQSSDDWALAYCQAELYAEHLVERFGEGVLAAMLDAYRDGLETSEAIERCCGGSVADFEKSYTAHLRELTSELVASGAAREERSFVELRLAHQSNPDDLDVTAKLAEVHLTRKEYPPARTLAAEALAADPKHQLASFVLARLHLVTGERDEAKDLLAACLDEEDPEAEVVKLLASLRLQSDQTDEAVRLLKLGARHFPRDSTWMKSLAAIALKAGDDERVTAYLEQLAPVDADNLPIRKKLAALAAKRGDHARAARWATASIHIDVEDVAMHKLRAASLASAGRAAEAADAYRVAVLLRPGESELWSAYRAACRNAGLSARATAVAREWLEAHPDDAEARTAVEEHEP
jgi:tetratricopeptide (TPR) repeat protein